MWFKKKNKRMDNNVEKFLKEQIKAMAASMEDYKAKWLSLCSHDLDYIFLRELFDEVSKREPGFRVDITLADGTKLEAYKVDEKKSPKQW